MINISNEKQDINTINPASQLKAAVSSDGDHTPIEGIMSMLNVFLNQSLTVLNLFDSMNKNEVAIAGMLQSLGLKEASDVHGLTVTLQADIATGKDGSQITSDQAAIADTQLTEGNSITTTQTKGDLVKDGSTSIEQEVSSLLQSISSGLTSILQNLNSIRIN